MIERGLVVGESSGVSWPCEFTNVVAVELALAGGCADPKNLFDPESIMGAE